MTFEIQINFTDENIVADSSSDINLSIDFITNNVIVKASGDIEFGHIDNINTNAVWGQIIGNIQYQTDLQNQLNAKQDLIGINPSGDANKYLNELGEWQTISIPQAPSLQDVTDTGNTTTNNIQFNDGSGVYFENGARVTEGTTDSGNGGNKGVALKCSVDYELKWEAGRLYVMEQNGFNIREVSHNFNITPTSNDDDTKGFVIGSRWILDNGDVYECTDATTGSAVWVLQTIDLSGYVPYTGATQNVDLGTHGIKTDYVEFNLTPTAAAAAGKIVYDGATGALKYLLNNSNVTSQIGQTLHAYVHNAESIQINKGQAVYLYQASGNKASVKLAFNTGDSTSAKTLGLAAENIAAGQNGMIICQGVIDKLNTGTFNEGDTLYLGATAGSLTKIKPSAPNHLVYIGVVEKANNGNGQIYVKVQNGYELEELHNVSITSPANNNILIYDYSTSLWKNATANSIKSERRNDWQSPYSYCGSALNGSAESSAVWTIYRIQVASDGTVTTLSATNVKWIDRYSVIYT